MKKLILISFILLCGCTPQAPQGAPPVGSKPSDAATTAPLSDTPTAANDSAEAPIVPPHNLNEAIDQFSMQMADFTEGQYSQGALLLTAWASENMKWRELKNIDSGKYAMVLKDSETQRGKKYVHQGK